MTGVCVQSLSADALVTDLGSRVADVFAATISEGPVALVDFPDHSNVGDSAIWLGEMAWLDGNGRLPIYSAALNNFSETDLLRAAPQGPILIHGGGNFGTTWPKHEALRLKLLRAFPGRSIVQLPQRSEEHTSELPSLMRTSYAVFCLKKKNIPNHTKM